MNLIRDWGGRGRVQYSTVRDEAKEEARPHKRALPQRGWSLLTTAAMNLIKDSYESH